MNNLLKTCTMVAATAALPGITGEVNAYISDYRYNPSRTELSEKKLGVGITLSSNFKNSGGVDLDSAVSIADLFLKELKNKVETAQAMQWNSLIYTFAFSASHFLSLGFKKNLRVELTSANSLFMIGRRNNVSIYLETFFDKSSGCAEKTVINIWEGRKQLFTETGTLGEILNLHQYFSTKLIATQAKNPFGTSYGVSGSPFTTATL